MSHHDPDQPLDDAALALRIGRAAGIDREAEAELCRSLAPRVRLYGLRHLRDPAAAADLVQQVLLMTIERLRAGALREPQRLASFVFGICRLRVLELRRRQSRRQRLMDTYGEHLVPPEPVARDLDTDRLEGCLQDLPERERTVLIMTFYEELPADALAQRLGMTTANVRVVRHRGLKRMRVCMEGSES